MSAAGDVRFHARTSARVVGAACVIIGLFVGTGAFLADDVGPAGAVVVVAAAGVFVYLGGGLTWGHVSARRGVLTIRDGLRARRITADDIIGLELCDARLYISGQRTVGVRCGGDLVRLNLLARYVTPGGLRQLDEQRTALSRALDGGSEDR